MRATDLLSRRNRFEIIHDWNVIGEVFVLDPRYISVKVRPLKGIIVRRGKRGA